MKQFAGVLSIVFAIAGVAGAGAYLRRVETPAVAAAATQSPSLKPPDSGKINVAFVVSKGADLLDISGSWEVFNLAMLTSKGKRWNFSDGDDMVMPFHTYTVSDSLQPIHVEGLNIIPDHTFDDAPKPQIIVIPAQDGRSAEQKKWLLANSADADVTMSICTGAGVLADYGMLDGQAATTHHLYWSQMQKRYPAVHFVSGTRFVEHGRIATAGGVTSGIDLALHIVDRYYGRDVAQTTAEILEYRGDLWKNPEYEQVKAVVPAK
jgi:transcriptional regulator GlxA family with amidase domain